MGEHISEQQPRIKFQLERLGGPTVQFSLGTPELQALMSLMERMEQLGAAPLLNDNAVGGNCGMLIDLPDGGGPSLFVTRSGKPPGLHLTPADFVQIVDFDKAAWRCQYRSTDPGHKPTSDTPLLQACLSSVSQERHHWTQQPRVALHGHALATGEGLDAARTLNLPISEHETLFSTPADLNELETLLMAHPYPAECCFIRRGHGFFILGGTVAHAEATFDRVVVPFLLQQKQPQQELETRKQASAVSAEL
eukprot:GHUV01019014.1.p1 GENE.GHUV01019014.1~~GHUV01019014.1.p1  ORF type:complete len:251 (+),score=57.08 GHUV01019014.1:162-914(+)